MLDLVGGRRLSQPIDGREVDKWCLRAAIQRDIASGALVLFRNAIPFLVLARSHLLVCLRLRLWNHRSIPERYFGRYDQHFPDMRLSGVRAKTDNWGRPPQYEPYLVVRISYEALYTADFMLG